MIVESIVSIIFGILDKLLLLLPDIQWNVDTGIFATFFDFIDVVLYIFPKNVVILVIGLNISIIMFKAIISLIKTIWALLPVV